MATEEERESIMADLEELSTWSVEDGNDRDNVVYELQKIIDRLENISFDKDEDDE